MARCPNGPRKRKSAGGGTPGCEGHVKLVVRVPAMLDIKRIPRGGDGFEDIVKASVRKRGIKVPAIDLARVYAEGKFDIICPSCGWRLSACISGPSSSSAKSKPKPRPPVASRRKVQSKGRKKVAT